MRVDNRRSAVFIHGFMGVPSDYCYRPLLDDCIVQPIIIPGHSGVPCAPSISWDTISSGLLSQIKLEPPFHLYGYSMGGRVAMKLAYDYPEYISSLTLESSHPGLKDERDRLSRRCHDEEIAHKLTTSPFDEFLDQWYEVPMWGPISKWHGYKDMLADRLRSHDPSQLARALLALSLSSQPFFNSFLASVSFPVTLITGEKDVKFTALSKALASECPSITHTIIQNAYHLPFLQLS